MRLTDKYKRMVMCFLCADLLISAGFLAYAVNVRSKSSAKMESVFSAIQEGVKGGSSLIAGEKNHAAVSVGKEQMAVDRKIGETRQNVKEELSRQKETYRESVIREDGWVTLEELKSISQEAYDECVRQLEYERGECAKQLEKRRKVIAELRTDLLTEDELKELKEALEFLDVCDDCTARGVPMPDRSADYDRERKDRLMRIARKYCCGLAGCSEEAIDMHDKASIIADGGRSYYVPILPKNVYNLKYE